MKSIESEQQFLMYLKTKKIIIKDYDYTQEDEDKDPEYFRSHPFKRIGKRYYQNPMLWKYILDNKYSIAIEYMLSHMSKYIDSNIVLASISSSIDDDTVLDIIHKHVENYKENNKDIDYDAIIHSITLSNRDKVLYYIMDYLNNHKDIKPRYGTWGNGNNGLTFIESVKIGNEKIIDLLIDNGSIDISSDSGWCYIIALKYGRYDIAKKIIDKNNRIDIHMKNDLGLKMIQRNDRNKNIVPIGIMKDCREYLLSLY